MENRLIICTAPVHSGKTSKLMRWSDSMTDLGGILCPDVHSLRKIYHLSSGRMYDFQLADDFDDSTGITYIGKYKFKSEAFDIARKLLREDANDDSVNTIIIDEVGKLEMKAEGLEPAVTELVNQFRMGDLGKNLILVIRDYLLDDALKRYDLPGAKIIDLSTSEKFKPF